MEYIDGNEIFDVGQGDLSILRGELLRRENGISSHDWEQNKDLFDRFGLPKNLNTKDDN